MQEWCGNISHIDMVFYIVPVQYQTPSKLATSSSLAANITILANNTLDSRLLMRLTEQRTLVELLGTRRHIHSRVSIKEVDRLQANLDNLTRHDWEVFNAWDVVDAELNKHNEIFIDDVVFAVSPAAYASASTGLVGIFAAGVEFAVAVLHGVNVAVGEFDALVVEAVFVGDTLLEWWCVDLVGDWLVVDGVEDIGILNLEGAVRVWVKVVTAGL
jgi:hypothetical protein